MNDAVVGIVKDGANEIITTFFEYIQNDNWVCYYREYAGIERLLLGLNMQF